MTPQDQLRVDPIHGDCFATCVACMLDLPRADVPNFMEAGPGPEWWVALQDWLGERGLWCEAHSGKGAQGQVTDNPPGYWIASGKSPRGDYHHAVVFHGDTLAHDPHPSRVGLDGPPLTCFVLAPARGRQTTITKENSDENRGDADDRA